jgi:hypothetical protein
MPLIKATLQNQLQQIIEAMPSRGVAPAQWAMAYVSYAAVAMSSAGSLPVTAMVNLGMVVGGFSGGFSSESASDCASAIANGIKAFWQAMVWVGGTAAGSTVSAGNSSLSSSLESIFSNVENCSAPQKAGEIADAFHLGAMEVMVNDILFIQPAPPLTGPIS